jgi:hypothetical protein
MKHIITIITIFLIAVSCTGKKSSSDIRLRESHDSIDIFQQKVTDYTTDLEVATIRGDQITDEVLWSYGVYTSGMVIQAVRNIKVYGIYTTKAFDFLFTTISLQEEWISQGSELLQEDQKYNCFRQELQSISEIRNLLPEPYLSRLDELNSKYSI